VQFRANCTTMSSCALQQHFMVNSKQVKMANQAAMRPIHNLPPARTFAIVAVYLELS
jgi:hypothetical protein